MTEDEKDKQAAKDLINFCNKNSIKNGRTKTKTTSKNL